MTGNSFQGAIQPLGFLLMAASFREIAMTENELIPDSPLPLPGENFPMTAAVDAEGNFAFVAHIVDHKLSIIELATGETRSIEWLTEPGPSYVAVQP